MLPWSKPAIRPPWALSSGNKTRCCKAAASVQRAAAAELGMVALLSRQSLGNLPIEAKSMEVEGEHPKSLSSTLN